MNTSNLPSILKQIEAQLAMAGELPAGVEQAFNQLLNLVEALCFDKKALADEVQRLRKLLDRKKKNKTTANNKDNDEQESNSDHSSEKHRRKREKPKTKPTSDRRSFKELSIHKEIECPVNPAMLPGGCDSQTNRS